MKKPANNKTPLTNNKNGGSPRYKGVYTYAMKLYYMLNVMHPGNEHLGHVVSYANELLLRANTDPDPKMKAKRMLKKAMLMLYLRVMYDKIHTLEVLKEFHLAPQSYNIVVCSSNLKDIIETPIHQMIPSFIGNDCSIYFQHDMMNIAWQYLAANCPLEEFIAFDKRIQDVKKMQPVVNNSNTYAIVDMFHEFRNDPVDVPQEQLENIEGLLAIDILESIFDAKSKPNTHIPSMTRNSSQVPMTNSQNASAQAQPAQPAQPITSFDSPMMQNANVKVNVVNKPNLLFGGSASETGYVEYLGKVRKVNVDEMGKYIMFNNSKIFLDDIRGKYKKSAKP